MHPARFAALILIISPLSAQVDWTASGGRTGHTIAALGNGIVLAGGLSSSEITLDDTWELPSTSWVSRTGPNTRLPAMHGHAMAGASGGRVILFGGSSAVGLPPVRADTWVWDGNNWSLVTPVGPAPRMFHAMAHDWVRDEIVLFGGFDGTTALGDTWVLDLAAQPLRWRSVVGTMPPARHGHTMAYDALGQRVVLVSGADRIGGGGSGALFDDHWEWNGVAWLQRSSNVSGLKRWRAAMAYDIPRAALVLVGGFDSANNSATVRPVRTTYIWNGAGWATNANWDFPDPRGGHAMGFHVGLGAVVLYGGAARSDSGANARSDTWQWRGSAWTQLSANLGPFERSAAAMCFDAARQTAAMFGGDGTISRLQDTWTWDGLHWIEHVMNPSPPARARAAMVFDTARQRSVLFGGSGNTLLDDTWEWDGVAWRQTLSSSRPGARFGHAMAFDSLRARIVMFGGDTGTAQLGDTWEWDGADWIRRTPWNAPSPRRELAMTFDPVRGRTVLFGGWHASSNALGDTWEWNGTNWAFQGSATLPPRARFGHAMVFDARRGRVVLFGGSSGIGDTWEWDGIRWSQRAPTNQPTPRTGHGLAFDASRNRTVLFGGATLAGRSSELWEYAALAGPSSFDEYGAGCPGTSGVPAIDASALPWLGETFAIDLTGVLEPAGALLLLGLGPIDLDLTGFGMLGCHLRTTSDLVFPFARLAPRQYRIGLPIPLDSNLIGGAFHTQALVLDPLANTPGLVLSNARRGVFDAR